MGWTGNWLLRLEIVGIFCFRFLFISGYESWKLNWSRLMRVKKFLQNSIFVCILIKKENLKVIMKCEKLRKNFILLWQFNELKLWCTMSQSISNFDVNGSFKKSVKIPIIVKFKITFSSVLIGDHKFRVHGQFYLHFVSCITTLKLGLLLKNHVN